MNEIDFKTDEEYEKIQDSLYTQLGYSNVDLYQNTNENIMDYKGRRKLATKFNLKESDILIIIKVVTESAAYQRTAQKSMMATKASVIIPPTDDLPEIFKDLESLIQTRQTHMREVAEIARIIANALGLNKDFAYLIGLLHDIGHTWNGHSGERVLSSIENLENCGYIAHSAMGAYIIERENIIETAIKSLKQFKPNIDVDEVKRFMRYVIDGVVSHNGEGTDGRIEPEKNKTIETMTQEIRKCFTEKGFDKTIKPASMEAAIIRYADIIAYTRSDILDGFRLKTSDGGKILNEFTDDYLAIIGTCLARNNNYNTMLTLENKLLLEMYGISQRIEELPKDIEEAVDDSSKEALKRELGYSKKELEMLKRKYDEFKQYKIGYARRYVESIPASARKTDVTQMMQNVFIKDLIENSKGKKCITMSPLIRRTFFALRELNSKSIVPYTRREFEAKELPEATRQLVDIYKQSLIKTGVAYHAIPEDERSKIIPRSDNENQELEIELIEKKEEAVSFERKMMHYYQGLEPSKKHKLYYNAVNAIKDITRHDIEIALGEKKYDGDLKDVYMSFKIEPLKRKIKSIGRELTSEDIEKLYQSTVDERTRDIESILAAKMAIEYIGGMTDNTIISLLLHKGLIDKDKIIEGYGRPVPGKQQEDPSVTELQKIFGKYPEMIVPDNLQKLMENNEFTL